MLYAKGGGVMHSITISLYHMTRVGWRGGEEEATQFSFVTTLPPDRGYRRSSIHMSAYLSIALDVSERPPLPLPPHPASATYFILIKIDSDTDGLALVRWAAAFYRMYIVRTCFAERRYIFLRLKYTFFLIYVNSVSFKQKAASR